MFYRKILSNLLLQSMCLKKIVTLDPVMINPLMGAQEKRKHKGFFFIIDELFSIFFCRFLFSAFKTMEVDLWIHGL